jgi:hypothetical protein
MLNRLIIATVLGFAASATLAASAADWFSEVSYGRVDYGQADAPDTYGVGLGVFLNDYFGAQLDWAYAEQPPVGTCPIPPCITIATPSHRIGLRALGRLPLGKSFELIGGLGRLQYSHGAYNYTQYVDLMSLSAGWRINETFTLGVERQVTSTDVGSPDVNIDSVTFSYRF